MAASSRRYRRAKNEIDYASSDGIAGHAVEFGGLILDERDAADVLDGLKAEGAVGGAAGEDDADGAAFLVFGEGAEEMIDGKVFYALRFAWSDLRIPPRMVMRLLGGMT